MTYSMTYDLWEYGGRPWWLLYKYHVQFGQSMQGLPRQSWTWRLSYHSTKDLAAAAERQYGHNLSEGNTCYLSILTPKTLFLQWPLDVDQIIRYEILLDVFCTMLQINSMKHFGNLDVSMLCYEVQKDASGCFYYAIKYNVLSFRCWISFNNIKECYGWSQEGR